MLMIRVNQCLPSCRQRMKNKKAKLVQNILVSISYTPKLIKYCKTLQTQLGKTPQIQIK